MRRLLAALLLAASPAHAAILEVGPTRALKLPSEAAAVAQDGDTVRIDAGEYFDCAIWIRSRLTVEGAEGEAAVTDKACEGKAVFVLRGDDITVRNLTLSRARVADGNGAGIRAEGRNPTVEQVRFVNNQAGMLANAVAGSTVTVANSVFERNGACDVHRCASGLQVGEVDLLRVTGTRFADPRGGDQIVSRAARTELRQVLIEDGAGGASRYALDLPLGGTLDMRNCDVEKGPRSAEPRAAILVGEGGGLRPDAELRFTGNRFVNHTGAASRFVLNWTSVDPVLADNRIAAGDAEISRDGVWWHRARTFVGEIRDALRATAGGLRRAVRSLLGR